MSIESPLLIIENDDTDLMIFKHVLDDINYSLPVVFIKDTDKAIEYLSLSTGTLPWLIFLDLNLPKTSGLEFLKSLKTTPPFHWIPVIILTSSENPDDIKSAARNGCCGYLLKEFEYDKFKESIAITLKYWARCLTPIRSETLNLTIEH